MAYNRNNGGPSAEDKALERFADLMIKKIETISGDWKKPWFSERTAWPRNIYDGKHYDGLNGLMLSLYCEEQGYKIPVFGTFDRFLSFNYSTDGDGNRQQLLDDNGEPLPKVSVNKGEKSFPLYFTSFTVIDKETKEKIKWDDYKKLSAEEQKRYNVFPKTTVWPVFAVEQTNLREARPEMWQKLVEQNTPHQARHEGDMTSHPAIDRMIDGNHFYCPIRQVKGDDAYYSISKDEIVIPLREQFVDGEAFASNALHEMSHATGSEGRLARLKPAPFGSPEYAREELVAELSAAVVSNQYGLDKHIKEDSAAYLKSWLGSLKESPDFIRTTLTDVKKATSMVSRRIGAVQQVLDAEQGRDAAYKAYDDYSQEMSGKYGPEYYDRPEDLAKLLSPEEGAEFEKRRAAYIDAEKRLTAANDALTADTAVVKEAEKPVETEQKSAVPADLPGTVTMQQDEREAKDGWIDKYDMAVESAAQTPSTDRYGYVAVGEYYGNEELRSLAHGIKDGDGTAIAKAAALMSPHLPQGSAIIPMPSHEGWPAGTLALCIDLARNRPDITVLPLLHGQPRTSLYDAKRDGVSLPEDSLKMTVTGKVPTDREVFIIDNVIATGETARAAIDAIPSAKVLVLADDVTKEKVWQHSASESRTATLEGNRPDDWRQRYDNDFVNQPMSPNNSKTFVQKQSNDMIVDELLDCLKNGVVTKQEGPQASWLPHPSTDLRHYQEYIVSVQANAKFEITAILKGNYVDEYDDIVSRLDGFAVSKIEKIETNNTFGEYDEPIIEDVVIKSTSVQLSEEQYHAVADLFRKSGVGGLTARGLRCQNGARQTQPFVRERYDLYDNSKNFSSLQEALSTHVEPVIMERRKDEATSNNLLQAQEFWSDRYSFIGDFSEGLATVKNGDRWGFVNASGREVIPCQYEDGKNFFEGLAVVEKAGKWGTIDKSGNEVVPCRYDFVNDFFDGFARVRLAGKWGTIDKSGNEVVPCRYDFVNDFSDGFARVRLADKWGYVDTSGKEVVPCKFKTPDKAESALEKLQHESVNGKHDFEPSHEEHWSDRYSFIGDFFEGLAVVEKAGKRGYVDQSGNEVIPCQYDVADVFSEGLGAVKKGNRWGFVDKSGTEVIPCRYKATHPFHEGLAAVKKRGKKGDRWGFVDKSGKEVVSCQYDAGTDFSEGLAAVSKNGKVGFIDTTGKEVIPFLYDDVFAFSEGFIGVQKDGMFGYVDTSGQEVVPCEYSISDVDEELERVKLLNTENTLDSSDSRHMSSSAVQISADWSDRYIFIGKFSEGLAAVERGDRRGFIDETGREVIPCQYDDVAAFSAGIAMVLKDGKIGFIDTAGKEVVPCQYTTAEYARQALEKLQHEPEAVKKETVPVSYTDNVVVRHRTEQNDIIGITDERTLNHVLEHDRLYKPYSDIYVDITPIASSIRTGVTSSGSYTAPSKESPDRVQIQPDSFMSGRYTLSVFENDSLKERQSNLTLLQAAEYSTNFAVTHNLLSAIDMPAEPETKSYVILADDNDVIMTPLAEAVRHYTENGKDCLISMFPEKPAHDIHISGNAGVYSLDFKLNNGDVRSYRDLSLGQLMTVTHDVVKNQRDMDMVNDRSRELNTRMMTVSETHPDQSASELSLFFRNLFALHNEAKKTNPQNMIIYRIGQSSIAFEADADRLSEKYGLTVIEDSGQTNAAGAAIRLTVFGSDSLDDYVSGLEKDGLAVDVNELHAGTDRDMSPSASEEEEIHHGHHR